MHISQHHPDRDLCRIRVCCSAGHLVVLFFFYFPPKHPRGIPWGQALKQLDYMGIITFTAAAAMVLSAIVYVQYLLSNDPKIISLLVVGFACLIFSGVWESFAPLKEPLAPTRLFVANKGRSMTAPFIVGFVVTMFYYATNITWPNMVEVYFTSAATPPYIVYLLATVQGFGILTGAMLLSFLGTYIQHWRFQMGVPITFFGGMLSYVTTEREILGIAFAFLVAMFYGYGQCLSIAYIQFGGEQLELGIAGGLAGVARYAGGAVAVTLFQTILTITQTKYAVNHFIPAAEAACASPTVAKAVFAALPSGIATLENVQGLTTAIAEAAGAAYVESYVQGVKTVALALIGFGGLAMVACCFLEDIGQKMNSKIEIYLENDVYAEKNKYH